MISPVEPAPGFVLTSARVATPTEVLADGFVYVEGGSVRAVGRVPFPRAPPCSTSATS